MMRSHAVRSRAFVVSAGLLLILQAMAGARSAPATGTIAGSVTDGSLAPLENITVQIIDSLGAPVASPVTGADGLFTVDGLQPGLYFARTFNSQGYIDVTYGNVPAHADWFPDSLAITVTDGGTATPVFQLDLGGRIAGLVTEDGSTDPIAGVWINVYDSAGRLIGSTNPTDATGNYVTLFGLPAGDYFVSTSNSVSWVDETYDNYPLLDRVINGTPVAVSGTGTTGGIDFALQPGGTISGHVSAPSPEQRAGAWISVMDGSGRGVSGASVDGDGNYTTGLLPAGTYYVAAGGGTGLIAEIYNNVTCLNCGITGGTPVAVTAGLTTPGINFDLAAGGRIAGHISDAVTANPVAGVWVYIFDASNRHVGTSAQTDASGDYVTSFGLPAGTYYAQTDSNAAYVNEAYDNLPLATPWQNRTPIAVTDTSIKTGIDFALAPGGRISGTVTDAGTGFPVSWYGGVTVYDSQGVGVAGTNLDGSGHYVTPGVPAGDYYVVATSGAGHIAQIYPGVTCLGCGIAGGTTVNVSVGATTSGIDFALVRGGSIAATITDAGSSLGIAGASFNVFDSTGRYLGGSSATGSSGTCKIEFGLPAGSYYVGTNNRAAYINEMYDNVPCLNCSAASGALVPVTLGATANVAFALDPGGRVSGHITNADGGAPLAGAWVDLVDSTGTYVGSSAQTDAGGYYVTESGLPSGTYTGYTNNNGAFVNKAYDNLPIGTPWSNRTPITVTAPDTTADVDFQLSEGGRISGHIEDAITHAALPGVNINIFDSAGNGVNGGSTDVDGNYLTSGLPAGTYYAKTDRYGAYIMTLYDGTPFLQGNVTTGTPIAVSAGSTTPGIDFALVKGGQIAGHISAAVGGAMLANISVNVADASGTFIWGWENPTDAAGAYITTGLPAGTYYIRTESTSGYVNEFYDNLPYGSNVTSTTPVVVALGATTPDIDFHLSTGGFISGVVLKAGGGAVEGASVNFYDSSGQYAGSTGANVSGAYVSPALAAGSYYVSTGNNSARINEVYDNIPCVNCSVTIGTLVPVTVGATHDGINFALDAGGRISGRITNAAGGAGIAGVWVDFRDAANGFVGSSPQTDAGGYYTTEFGLPTGTYYASTNNNEAFINEAYDNLPGNTNPASRTPIPVTAGATTPDIDFQLAAGGRISGQVVAAGTLLPLANVGITFFDTTGDGVSGTSTDATGHYLSQGMPAGTYFARANQGGIYIQTLYPSTPCLNCDVRTGTAIPVTVGNTTPGIDFALVVGGQIAGHMTNADGGAPLGNVNFNVELSDADGRYLGGQSGPPDAAGAYITNGLPAGTYYIRTAGDQDFVGECYDNLPLSTNATSTTPVIVSLGQVHENVDFALAAGGRISGTVRNQESQPLSGVGISIYDSVGQNVGNAETDASGAYTSSALAAGSYYVQTHSFGAYIRTNYPDVFYLYGSNTIGTAVPVTVGNTTSGTDFTLVRGGQIAGHVTVAGSSTPIVNVNVQLFNASGQGLSGWDGPSDAAGAYTTRGLPAGTYYVQTTGSHGYVNEYYDNLPLSTNATSATPVTVTLNTVTTGKDFQLSTGGFIAGTITNWNSEPVAGMNVSFYDSAGSYVFGSQTDASGHYTSPTLAAGSYYVQSGRTAPYIQVVYPNVPYLYGSVTTGTAVPVTVGNTTTGIDMTLVRGGQIAGHVTDALTALSLSGVQFAITDSTGQGLSNWEWATGTSGNYQSRGLPAGTYYIRTAGTHDYVNEYYSNLPFWTSWSSATPVVVTLGSVTGGIDFALDPGGRISGRVTAAIGGAGVGGVYVAFHDSAGHFLGNVQTNSQGYYTSQGLAAGPHFASVFNPGNDFIPQLYDNITCVGCNETTGTPIPVTVGATTPNINFALLTGGHISGTITDNATSLGISGLNLELFNASGSKVGNSGNTSSSGQYTYSNSLPPGTYYGRTRNGSSYTHEVYDNLPIWTTMTAGTPIVVTGGATTTVNFGLDANPGPNTPATAVEVPIGLTENRIYTAGNAPDTLWYKVLVPPSEAGKDLKVNVRVTSPYPDPIPSGWGSDLDFEILDSALKVRATAVSASDNETLYLHNVAAGDYYIYISFSSTIYADTDLAARYAIDVETGSAADFGIGYISGRVLDTNGQGVEQAYVRAFSVPANNAVSFPTVTAGPGGYFTMAVLPGYHGLWITGDGSVSENQPAINVVEEYYSNKLTQFLADTVAVSEGGTTTIDDVVLSIGAIVTGSVTNLSAQPLANAVVYSFTADGYSKSYARTDAGGNYTLVGVPAGGAKIRFSRGSYAQEFYDDQASLGQAGILATQGGTTINDVNAVLSAGGRITGTVRNTSAAPVAANIRLYSVLDSTVARTSTNSSGTDGSFTFSYVKPGQYKILFSPFSIGFVEQWYDNAASFAAAAVITVTEGGTVSGITAQLVPVAPEVAVTAGAAPVATGGAYAFGPRMLNSDTDVVFTIANTGDGGLTSSSLPLVVLGTDAYQFSVVAQPFFSVLPGTNTTFTVRFHPSSAGPKSAYISFANNDADENPYVVNFTGTGITSPLPAGGGDFTGDLKADILWRGPGGDLWVWGMVGATHALDLYAGMVADTNWEIRGQGDQNGDGTADLLWRNKATGMIYSWLMANGLPSSEAYVATVDTGYDIIGTGDFNGDGRSDIAWRHVTGGDVWVWLMNGASVAGEAYVDTVDPAYVVKGVGDVNGDTKADLVWEGAAGDVWVWLMNGMTRASQQYVDAVDDLHYQIQAVADFDGNGTADLLWWHEVQGDLWIWPMSGGVSGAAEYVGLVSDTHYRIMAAGDYDGDRKADLLWRNIVAGDVWVWLMNGAARLSEAFVGVVSDLDYQIVR